MEWSWCVSGRGEDYRLGCLLGGVYFYETNIFLPMGFAFEGAKIRVFCAMGKGVAIISGLILHTRFHISRFFCFIKEFFPHF